MAVTDTLTPERAAGQVPMPRGVVAHLTPSDAAAATEFYKKAFGAEEVSRIPGPNGKLMHVHLAINGGVLLLADYMPQSGHPGGAPQAISLLMAVDDLDAVWKRAIEAGCEEMMAPALMFWGHRYGQVRDPFGFIWALDEPND
ncbi:MAG TPA: VOC family protein [Caulobacteraceae bacterium]|nr:VOC family protein [Caulobacteraceae bacterium]